MLSPLPKVYLVRHGQTDWSRSGRHTGLTDIPLTDEGDREVSWLRNKLAHLSPVLVVTSPSRRARRTCELAGFDHGVEVWDDLHEWDYGTYEGLTTEVIKRTRPDWNLFQDGAPGGESPDQVRARADRVLHRLTGNATVLLFSHGHFIRTLAARWIGQTVASAASLACDPASLSILGCEHGCADPVIRLWNRVPDPAK